MVIFDTETLKKTGDIWLDGNGYEDSFTSDLLLNGIELLALDQANFRLVRIDLTTQKITASIPTGRQPFGSALSPDKNGPSPRLAFVANVGLYVYPVVPGVTKTNKDTMALKFPPYGAHTKESREGVEHEGRRIPGLGDPLTIDIDEPAELEHLMGWLRDNNLLDRGAFNHTKPAGQPLIIKGDKSIDPHGLDGL